MISISESVKSSGSSIFYDEGFRNSLEMNMRSLRRNNELTVISVPANDVFAYSGNLKGLMIFLGIPPELHWLTMRINNYKSMTETLRKDILTGGFTIRVPSRSMVEQIRSLYVSIKK